MATSQGYFPSDNFPNKKFSRLQLPKFVLVLALGPPTHPSRSPWLPLQPAAPWPNLTFRKLPLRKLLLGKIPNTLTIASGEDNFFWDIDISQCTQSTHRVTGRGNHFPWFVKKPVLLCHGCCDKGGIIVSYCWHLFKKVTPKITTIFSLSNWDKGSQWAWISRILHHVFRE